MKTAWALMIGTSLTAALVWAGTAHAADVATLAKAFGARPAASSVRISPNGDKAVFIAPDAGSGSSIVVADFASGETHIVTSVADSKIAPQWCHWKTQSRLVCSFYAISSVSGDRLSYSRMIAIDVAGTNMKIMGQQRGGGGEGLIQNSGFVVDWLPDDPDHILMNVWLLPKVTTGTLTASASRAGASVQKVDINTGAMQLFEMGTTTISGFDSDNHGNVRFLSSIENRDGYAQNEARYRYRAKGSRDWISMGKVILSEQGGFEFKGFDDSGEYFYALRPLNGRQALFAYTADGSGNSELIFARPDVDVDGLLRIGKFDRPVAATYTVEGSHYEFFEPDLKKLSSALSRALPGKPGVLIYDESWDGSKKLIFADSDSDPGRYLVFNSATKQLAELLPLRPEVADLTISPDDSVSYPTRDGAQVPGYITYPPGGATKNLPAIILPHGGPGARDAQGFDWLSQFFAQLGYVVLQPNFRGSTGYGETWYGKNGFKAWETAMGDINDGAHWLVAKGIADPKRLAIFGWSYGGYAALQANVLEPDLYKAAIAVAPVTDLNALKSDALRFSNYKIEAAFLGTGPHLTQGSPANNAKRFKVPVLLFHGDQDLNVDIQQSRIMDSALSSAGVEHQLIVYKGLDHSLIDSRIRADVLSRSAEFLTKAMGAPN